jgi:hypothetical protein
MSMSTLRAGSQPSRSRPPLPGMPDESQPLGSVQRRDLCNVAGQVYATRTITAAGATNFTDYDLILTGEDGDLTVTYTSDGSASTAEVSAGLYAAVTEDPALGAYVRASVVSSTVFRLTARVLGDSIDITSTQAGADITIGALTSTAEAAPVYPGRVCMFTQYDTRGSMLGGTVLSTRLTADVWTLTPTYAASERYTIIFTFEGTPYPFDVLADTDTAATCTAIAAAINAKMPANTVVAAAGATTVTLTSEKAGAPIENVAVGVASANASRLTLAHTNTAITADINRCGLGIAEWRSDIHVTDTSGDIYYPANDTVSVVAQGTYWVDATEAITPGAPVYVETASGADQGKLFATASATRIRWAKARWERRDTTYDLGVVRVNTLD